MEKRILRLCRGLDASVYDVHAVSLRPTSGPMIDWPEDQRHFYPIAPGFHAGQLLGLARFMREGRYDIVHSHNWATMLYGVLAGRLARAPIVLHGEHGLNDDDRKGVSWRRRAVSTAIAHAATGVVAVNDFIKRQSEERWHLPSARVVSIPNGVDLDRFSPGRRARAEGAELVFGTVARFDPIKNLPCIVRGFALFRQANPTLRARLVLVGDGPLRGEVEGLAASLPCGDAVEFPGETQTPEDWYPEFDVFINGSLSEGMSNTILEGMACGLPVVASDVPGNRSWLEEDSHALFFESDNAGALADRLAALAKDAARRRDMGRRNRLLAERAYDNRDFLQRYHRLYQRLLGQA